MMELEVFFDYACPYCLRAHEYLTGLMPLHKDLSIIWRPCEAHPRPDRYGMHSDLCARGMYHALEHGVDLPEYHEIMYKAALKDRVDIEDLRVLSDLLGGLTDSEAFCKALSGGAYLDRLLENNRLAWQEYRFPAVPSYRMKGRLLKCVEDVGVTKRQLAGFIEKNIQSV